MRRLVLALCLPLLACATPTIDPSTIEVRAVRHGVYETSADAARLVETTTRIRCRLGVSFGVSYRFSFPEGSRGRVPLEVVWHHPEIDAPELGVTGTTSPMPPFPRVPRGAVTLETEALWTLSDPAELVSGSYEVSVRVLGEDRVLHQQAFLVSGC